VQPRRGRRYQGEEQCNGDSKPELKPKDKDKEDDDSHAFTMKASHYEPLSIENDNVWSLIPELSKMMHDHQKKASGRFLFQCNLIRDRKNLRDFDETPLTIPGVPNPTGDVKHVLDCLEKIKKWHLHPSVLVIGVYFILSLTRESSKYEHKKYMAKALRESTGILILDEGHNPRSTKSRLRKELMKVETELRILLSGTLFQNILVNTSTHFAWQAEVCSRSAERIRYKQKKGNDKIPEKAKHLLETRARKFFLDDIANKIDSWMMK
ncbi:SNF2-related, N-terminal domain, partial [Sesbania bispinosa]